MRFGDLEPGDYFTPVDGKSLYIKHAYNGCYRLAEDSLNAYCWPSTEPVVELPVESVTVCIKKELLTEEGIQEIGQVEMDGEVAKIPGVKFRDVFMRYIPI